MACIVRAVGYFRRFVSQPASTFIVEQDCAELLCAVTLLRPASASPASPTAALSASTSPSAAALFKSQPTSPALASPAFASLASPYLPNGSPTCACSLLSLLCADQYVISLACSSYLRVLFNFLPVPFVHLRCFVSSVSQLKSLSPRRFVPLWIIFSSHGRASCTAFSNQRSVLSQRFLTRVRAVLVQRKNPISNTTRYATPILTF